MFYSNVGRLIFTYEENASFYIFLDYFIYILY